MTNDGWPDIVLKAAHQASIKNRTVIDASSEAGCFRCVFVFNVGVVDQWIDGGQTALCPWCGVDSVIPSASEFPVTDRRFLLAMRDRWFGV